MKKYLQIIIALLLSDFVLFPIALQRFPEANFKMVMAAVGIVVMFFEWTRKRKTSVSNPLLWLTVVSIIMSAIAYVSITYNNTEEYTFVTYFISMLVWFFSAYSASRYIRHVHGKVDLILISKYLVAVSVMQCILALLIDNNPGFATFANSTFYNEYLDLEGFQLSHRIYGIGAALDIAGIRFCCVLVLLTNIMMKDWDNEKAYVPLLRWACFFFIAVIGSMISRTTTIGVIISLVYYFGGKLLINQGTVYLNSKGTISLFLCILIGIPIIVYFYNHNQMFQTHLRFGFEGFFNYFETGEFRTHSTDMLQTMYRWPDSFKTWVIGDGLFTNPDGSFYQYTDVGYIRFIYYFGLIGLSSFVLLYIVATFYGIKMSPDNKMVFLMLFAINMIVWMKVATDTFVVFALVLNACIMDYDDSENEEIEEENAV